MYKKSVNENYTVIINDDKSSIITFGVVNLEARVQS